MILCIDIGNTNIVSAIWDGKKFIDYSRIETYNSNIFEANHNFDKVALSSVVPNLTKLYIEHYTTKHNINPIVGITVSHENCDNIKNIFEYLTSKCGIDSLKCIIVIYQGVYKTPN